MARKPNNRREGIRTPTKIAADRRSAAPRQQTRELISVDEPILNNIGRGHVQLQTEPQTCKEVEDLPGVGTVTAQRRPPTIWMLDRSA